MCNTKEEKCRRILKKLKHAILDALPILLCYIVLVVCVGADISSDEYRTPWLEKIFTREYSEYSILLSIILAVWAATVTLIAFLLGRLTDKQYGVKLLHIIMKKHGKLMIGGFIGLFLVQIIITIMSVLCIWDITITILGFMQVFLLAYVFIVICRGMSDKNIDRVIVQQSIKKIEEDKEIELDFLMSKVISALNSKDNIDADKVIGYYKAISEKIDGEMQLKKWKKYVELSLDYFFEVCSDRSLGERVLCTLTEKVTNTDVYKWICRSIMKNVFKHNVPHILDLLKFRTYTDRREVIYYCIAYNAFYSTFGEQKYRRTIADELIKEIGYLSPKDKEGIGKEWLEIVEDYSFKQEKSDQKNYYGLKELMDFLGQ